MSAFTANLNKTLMRALHVHIGMVVVFLVTPALILYVIVLWGNESQNYINEILLLVLSSHSLFDIPAMLYFITPYRRYISGVLQDILIKLKLKNAVVPITTQPPPSSSNHIVSIIA